MSQASDAQLLRWAAGIVQQAQSDRAYGRVVIHVEAGRVTRAERLDSYMPPQAGRSVSESGPVR